MPSLQTEPSALLQPVLLFTYYVELPDSCSVNMCFDIGVVVCGPNEALVISGMFQASRQECVCTMCSFILVSYVSLNFHRVNQFSYCLHLYLLISRLTEGTAIMKKDMFEDKLLAWDLYASGVARNVCTICTLSLVENSKILKPICYLLTKYA